MLSRMGCHQLSGTGGCCHFAGSDKSPLWVGMTSVPSGVMTSINAWMTATAPPHTQPSELNEEWTRRVEPAKYSGAGKFPAKGEARIGLRYRIDGGDLTHTQILSLFSGCRGWSEYPSRYMHAGSVQSVSMFPGKEFHRNGRSILQDQMPMVHLPISIPHYISWQYEREYRLHVPRSQDGCPITSPAFTCFPCGAASSLDRCR